MTQKLSILNDIPDWGLCIGCGACTHFCAPDKVKLKDLENTGIRVYCEPDAKGSEKAMSICPGISVDGLPDPDAPNMDPEIGPYYNLYEGWASDDALHLAASSGGALSALALYCLENEKSEFALHTEMDPMTPWKTKTTTSRNYKDLLERTGSRYCPASPCDKLNWITEASSPTVFIGKPCDAAAVRNAGKIDEKLSKKTGLILSCFCAGTPTTQATKDLLNDLGEKEDELDSLRYRGNGWPGMFSPKSNGKQGKEITYAESWDILQRSRPFRCHLCPDGLGQTADISCGDAWNHPDETSPGKSIIITRTRSGSEIMKKAINAGYLKVTETTRDEVFKAQYNLMQRNAVIFGRLLAMKAAGVPIPVFKNFHIRKKWLRAGLKQQLKSILGTWKRIFKRNLNKKSNLSQRVKNY